ncbi:MAG: helix-hairpin-helix domain-containing protein [Flavobacteriales bacterium]|nr:helix-hairpin-helix domain-containing protein [Flavobacteriales bacterium]
MDFVFTKPQRYAVVFLVAIIIVFQALLYFDCFKSLPLPVSEDEKGWEAHQITLDSIQKSQDSIRQTPKPFNPNYLSDYKGYILGLSPEEIDRLNTFREKGNFLSSANEFQDITQISDSLLEVIKPYFKFPEFVNKTITKRQTQSIIKRINLNTATKEELMTISGIGEVRSQRILEVRSKLGGFYDTDQLTLVYGMPKELINSLKEYLVINKKEVTPNRININQSSLKELMAFPYFDYQLSKEIITYRTMHGNDIAIEDLYEIKGFPNGMVDIIALYLQF